MVVPIINGSLQGLGAGAKPPAIMGQCAILRQAMRLVLFRESLTVSRHSHASPFSKAFSKESASQPPTTSPTTKVIMDNNNNNNNNATGNLPSCPGGPSDFAMSDTTSSLMSSTPPNGQFFQMLCQLTRLRPFLLAVAFCVCHEQ